MSETQSWQDLSDDELLYLHSKGKLPKEAEEAIGSEQLRIVVAWDGMNGPRPALVPTPPKPEGPDYSSLDNDTLRTILGSRDLDIGGNKAKMVARLEASDLAGDDEDEDEDDDTEDTNSGEDEDDSKTEEVEEKTKAKSKKKKD